MKFTLVFSFILLTTGLNAQQIIPLYDTEIPNSIPNEMKENRLEKDGLLFGYNKISLPTLEIFLSEKPLANGAAVVICPGGGYAMESYIKEGTAIAKEFNANGISAFLLKYRLPSNEIMSNTSIGPLQDAQQALKLVRENAKEWNVNIDLVGIMGFSAGGHLASTAGTHFDKSYIPNPNNANLRPDFMILVYPVISMKDELAHAGSRRNLLGEKPNEELKSLFSNELHVSSNTPPTWITHTGDDTVVPVENSILFYQTLLENKVSAEMHLYPKGNHGFVLSIPTNEWMPSIFKWLETSIF